MTLFRRRGFFVLGAAATATRAAPRLARAQSAATLADTMAGDNRFSRFLDVVTRASAVDEFRQPAQLTVFAPVDQAFQNAPAGILQDLLGNSSSGNNVNDVERTRVLALIRNHIVPGAFTQADLTGADRRLRTLNGGDLQIASTGSTMTVRNPAPAMQPGALGAAGAQAASPARLVGGPIMASNGVIYPVDQIIWP